MQVSYEESIANYFGLRRRCGKRNRPVLSVRYGGQHRPAIELRNRDFRVPTTSLHGVGHIWVSASGKDTQDAAESLEPEHVWKSQTREPGEPFGSRSSLGCVRDGQGTIQWESLT